MRFGGNRSSGWILFWIAGYLLLRILLLPADPAVAGGFSHDSAYLAMVAQNLLSGKGLVLDALWLVFLNPPSLPMPFHNANPLFPLLTAGFSKVLWINVPDAAFLVSALAGVALTGVLAWILLPYSPNWKVALAASLLASLSLEPWVSSWAAMTDALWCLLALISCGVLLRSRTAAGFGLAGLVLGLAWLTRSMSTLLAPAVIAYILLKFPFRDASKFLLSLSAAALGICSPWLVFTALTWGAPLRSDSGFIFSTHAYYEYKMGTPWKVWHSPVPPASASELLRSHPAEVLRNWLSRPVPFLKRILLGAGGTRLGLTLVAVLALLLVARKPPAAFSPESLGVILYLATIFAVLSVLGPYMEARYFILPYTLFWAWVWRSVILTAREVTMGVRTRTHYASLLIAAAVTALVMAPNAYSAVRYARSPDQAWNVPYREISRKWNVEIIRGSPTVVGDHPYLFSLFTGNQSLSIPASNDEFLKRYMKQYGARFVLLSERERFFWRPEWVSKPPGDLKLIRSTGGFYLYALQD
jgi:hypothetical protein